MLISFSHILVILLFKLFSQHADSLIRLLYVQILPLKIALVLKPSVH